MTKAITTKMRPITKRYRNNHTSRYAHRPATTFPRLNILEIFYQTTKMFRPDIDKQLFSTAFNNFITMSDFTGMLKTVPDLPDLPTSKADMNDMLCKFTSKIKKISQSSQSRPRILRGGENITRVRHNPFRYTNEIIVFFIQFCFSIFILLKIPIKFIPFFAALILFMMINLTEYYLGNVPKFEYMPAIWSKQHQPYQVRAFENIIITEIPLIPIQLAHIPILIKSTFNWLKRLLGSGDSARTIDIDTLKPSHILLANHPYSASLKSRSPSPKRLRSKEAKRPTLI
jgi:hypothetical protein